MLLKTELKIGFASRMTFLTFHPIKRSLLWALGGGEGKSREDATWLTGGSFLLSKWEGRFEHERGRETMRSVKGNFPHQQDMDAGSGVAIRRNPSVL